MRKTPITIREWELLAFFGSEPVSREYGEQWYDSDSLYEKTDTTGIKITFAIHPVHKDVRVKLSFGPDSFYDWQAVGLLDIRYIEEPDRTILQLLITDTDSMTIRLEPRINITRFTNCG